jgi:hypothetical protein
MGGFKWDLWCTKWHWNRCRSEFFDFLTVISIPSSLHTHPSPPYEPWDSPTQAAQYHALHPKSGASPSTGTGLEMKPVVRTLCNLFKNYNLYFTYYIVIPPVWWLGLNNSPTVTHACRERRLNWVSSAWRYSWATLCPGVINTETWSTRLGVGRWTKDPAL